MKYIAYRKGYKYQLAGDYKVQITIRPETAVGTAFLALDENGWLYIKAGYAWDGPSGPTFDTKSSMRASLIHDALYQLMRYELLPQEDRDAADLELYKACIEDKMWKWRAKMWLRQLRRFAGGAADPKNKKRTYLAPEE